MKTTFLAYLSAFVCVLFGQSLYAQELLCNLTIDARQVQSDKQIFDDMQQNLSRYMNFTRFGTDVFEAHERIRCNIQIIVNARPSADVFRCTANIVAYRPAYNSTYESVVLNISDQNFNFNYVPFQQLQYVDNTFAENLTAMLNFYAFVIIGFDYGSFAAEGGVPYFRRAQEILNLANGAAQEVGWRSNEDTRNRYWLIENLTNSRYETFSDVLYQYHRQGLDQMESNPTRGRKAILDSLKKMQALNADNPLLYLVRLFLDAKDDEIISVFTKAFNNDKQAFVEVMNELDPSNLNEYEKVLKSK